MINKLVKFTHYVLLIGLLFTPRALFTMGRGGGGGQDNPFCRAWIMIMRLVLTDLKTSKG